MDFYEKDLAGNSGELLDPNCECIGVVKADWPNQYPLFSASLRIATKTPLQCHVCKEYFFGKYA